MTAEEFNEKWGAYLEEGHYYNSPRIPRTLNTLIQV
jgi:hypothetical protein